MAETIIMPQLGESIAEGTIVKWLKEVGQKVQKDENVLLISTDKVEAEIPSPSEGFLIDILVGPGETVAVGTVLGHVGQESEQKTKGPSAPSASSEKDVPKNEVPSFETSQKSAAPSSVPSFNEPVRARETSSNSGGFLSPLVKKIAQEHGVSSDVLESIPGTGQGGRVSKNDLLRYLEQKPYKKEATIPSPNPMPREMPQPFNDTSYASSDRVERKPISTMRRIIMENMMASKATSAHVTTFFEIDYTAIDRIRAVHKDQFLKEEQVSLTYTTFLAAAVCQALKRHPYINASVTKDGIIFHKDIHLGIAVAIDQPEPGLMVPIIKNADKQNLRGLAHAIHDLGTRTKTRRIKPDEISGGTFTITNPGNFGAIIGTPIINQPQVAILGVGRIAKQPTVISHDGVDSIGIKNMGILSLSFDHRLIDGATADQFMADLKKTLETWSFAP